MNVASVALQGIQQASGLAESSARRISGAADPGSGTDTVDLSAQMVALMQAKNLNSAMVSVIQTADEMDSHILNLLG
jgi:flagellar basal body rod protein FlgG